MEEDEDNGFDINEYINEYKRTGGMMVNSDGKFIMKSDDQDHLISFDDNEFVQLNVHPLKGRSVHAKSFIPRGTIILKDIPYVSIIDNRYKKNICNTCFKFFQESNRQNVKCCPGCGEVFYCSTYCQQQTRFAETLHTELECKWLHYFSSTYKHQLLEDDKNIVLIILRVLAKRIHDHKSLEFITSGSGNTTIPIDISDLCDHIDDYFTVSLEKQDDNTTINNIDMTNYIIKSELVQGDFGMIGYESEMESDYKLNWKHDFSKLLALSRIIQNILQPCNHQDLTNYNIDKDGDFKMNNNNIDDNRIPDNQKDFKKISKLDFNLLKLLGKVRANYFGLWNHDRYNNCNNNVFNNNNNNNLNGDDNGNGGGGQLQCYWAGAAVYLGLSLFNHSCYPNCSTMIQSDDLDGEENEVVSLRMANISPNYDVDKQLGRINPLTFYIVALRDIKQGDELLITYIPLDQKLADRRNQLKSLWLFDCDCTRCKIETERMILSGTETEMEEFRNHCCPKPGCNGGILVPVNPGSSYGSCRVCKLTYPLYQ